MLIESILKMNEESTNGFFNKQTGKIFYTVSCNSNGHKYYERRSVFLIESSKLPEDGKEVDFYFIDFYGETYASLNNPSQPTLGKYQKEYIIYIKNIFNSFIEKEHQIAPSLIDETERENRYIEKNKENIKEFITYEQWIENNKLILEKLKK